MSPLPCWRPRNVLARMNRARNFPEGTDPSSRHAAMIATALIRRGEYSMLVDEPEHCGISIAVTVELLWKARRDGVRLRGKLRHTQQSWNFASQSWTKEVDELNAEISRLRSLIPP